MTITSRAGRTGTFPDRKAALAAMAGDVWLCAERTILDQWVVTQLRERPVRCSGCFAITKAPSGKCHRHRPGGPEGVIDSRGDWIE